MKGAKIAMEIEFDSEDESKVVFEALRPELGPTDRTKVNLRNEKNRLHLEVVAKDSAAFRAALNSYFRWIRTSRSFLEES
ncbi:MAG: KEOPS complex subunit Pcc1 [Candidatus Hydrothermarchaeales archaeon]